MQIASKKMMARGGTPFAEHPVEQGTKPNLLKQLTPIHH